MAEENRVFKLAVVILLAAILVTQVAVLLKLPPTAPTLGEIRAATDRTAIYESIPLVHVRGGDIDVSGSVDVSGYVDAQVVNEPLEVEVSNVVEVDRW